MIFLRWYHITAAWCLLSHTPTQTCGGKSEGVGYGTKKKNHLLVQELVKAIGWESDFTQKNKNKNKNNSEWPTCKELRVYCNFFQLKRKSISQ